MAPIGDRNTECDHHDFTALDLVAKKEKDVHRFSVIAAVYLLALYLVYHFFVRRVGHP